jgi:hypothetical protein
MIVAALLLLFAAVAYFAVTDSAPEADRSQAPAKAQTGGQSIVAKPVTPTAEGAVADASSGDAPKGPAQPGLSVPAPSLLAMAGGPTVTPSTDRESVLLTLDSIIPKLKACAGSWVSSNPKLMGKAFFVFTVDDKGEPIDLSLQYKSVRDDTLDACFTTVLGGARFKAATPPAKVFWPIHVGGGAVVAVVGGAR